jgi:predicted RNA-binding Zn ribbon-like protein
MSNGSPRQSGDPVRLVLDFLNTVDVEEGTDAFSELPGFRDWTERHIGTPTGEASKQDWRAACHLRDTLRTAIGAPTASEPAEASVPVELHVSSVGEVSLNGSTAAQVVAAAVAELALTGDWPRVKICPADDCQVAFYDKSRNQSRHWCSMAVCGNRAKARAHRQRAS